MLGLCAEGMTILMVEHELAIMDEFCDPVIVMAEGHRAGNRDMSELRANVPRWSRRTLSAEPADPPRAEDSRAGYGAGDIMHGVSVSVAPRDGGVGGRAERVRQSTLIEDRVGVLRPLDGRVLIGDRDVGGLRKEEIAREGIGYVPQVGACSRRSP